MWWLKSLPKVLSTARGRALSFTDFKVQIHKCIWCGALCSALPSQTERCENDALQCHPFILPQDLVQLILTELCNTRPRRKDNYVTKATLRTPWNLRKKEAEHLFPGNTDRQGFHQPAGLWPEHPN